jgi:glycosyltransferase involved in cell wall biosynthesis
MKIRACWPQKARFEVVDWPKISIVIPSYNQGRFIEATLRSLIDQEYPNLELLIMDGGSKDESVEIIRRYAGHITDWVSEPDHGQGDALIKGFERATGDIEGWLCSDDLHERWTLHEVAQFFVKHPAAQVVYGDSAWIDTQGRPIKPKREHAFSRFIWTYDYNFIPQPSTFWRRELYRQVGGLDSTVQVAIDADLWIRFADVTALHHVRRYWSRMRLYPEQRNQRLRAQSNQDDERMRRRYLGNEGPASRKVKKVIAKCSRIAWKLATGCYWWGKDNPFTGGTAP